MVKGCTSIIFHTSTKGNNFYYSMFASLDKEAPPKEVYSRRKKFLAENSNFYTLRFKSEIMVVLLS